MQIIVVTNCNEKWIRNGKEELERWVTPPRKKAKTPSFSLETQGLV